MKPFAWSYSALSGFETCAKKHYHQNVIKDFKDEDSAESAEGKLIHESLAKRVIKGTALPMELRHLESIAKKFADVPGEKRAEMKLALNRKFEPVDFFAPDTWVRSVIDLLIIQGNVGILVDWKTGKRKPDHTQLGLSAAVAKRWLPEIELWKTMYVWTRERAVDPKNYTDSKLEEVWSSILPRVKKMEEARVHTNYPANPGGLCKKYCPVASCPHYQTSPNRY